MIFFRCDVCREETNNQPVAGTFNICDTCAPHGEEFLKGRAEIIADQSNQTYRRLENFRKDFLARIRKPVLREVSHAS